MNTIQKSLKYAKEGTSICNQAKGDKKREGGRNKKPSQHTKYQIEEIKRRRESKTRCHIKYIKYFMLKPEAKAVHYLQPGEIVGMKIGDKWVRFNLLKVKRLSL